jgi:AraC family transcriptional regulator of adaptative response / DNA-3-methyladenine glycosylase II
MWMGRRRDAGSLPCGPQAQPACLTLALPRRNTSAAAAENHVRFPHAGRRPDGHNRYMQLDDAQAYQAVLSRDARFDGRLFVGVTSTGIYCRPVCRVRTPRPANCRFFASHAAAEAAGFRPCLRCRPELAPGFAPIDAAPRFIAAAARLIDELPGEGAVLGRLAARLGVGERHLRRIFQAELGVSPARFVRTRRLLLAKQLLTETTLPVGELALAAGFSSLRAFNEAFRRDYQLSPGAFRRGAGPGAVQDVTLILAYRPPLDWPALLGFLARRSISGVEHADAHAYRRSVQLPGAPPGWLEVAPAGAGLHLRLSASLLPVLPAVLGRTRQLLDLACSPLEISAALGPLAESRPGLRLPGAFDGFEMAVRAILGQQVSVAAARTLAGRVAEAFGAALATPWPGVRRCFPVPAVLASLPVDALAGLGIVGRRAQTIIELARLVADAALELSPAAPLEPTLARLRAVPGIGEWTAQYIAMRALAWPDAFPAGDFGVRKALGGLNERAATLAAEAWRPWRAYAVMHLWAALEETA